MKKEEQKTIPCKCCGEPLYARDEHRDGDVAWYIDGSWYCEDCAEDMFLMEVVADDFI